MVHYLRFIKERQLFRLPVRVPVLQAPSENGTNSFLLGKTPNDMGRDNISDKVVSRASVSIPLKLISSEFNTAHVPHIMSFEAFPVYYRLNT